MISISHSFACDFFTFRWVLFYNFFRPLWNWFDWQVVSNAVQSILVNVWPRQCRQCRD